MSKQNSSKIKLKTKDNKASLFALFMIVCIVVVFVLSKFYLPDGRKNKTTFDSDSTLALSNVRVTIDDYSYNPELQIGEFRITERVKNIDEKYKIDYSVYDEYENELSYNVIESDYMNVKGEEYERYVIVQYGISSKYYFVNLDLSQPTIQDRSIYLDYRDNPESEIKEKGDNFVKEYQNVIFDYLHKGIAEEDEDSKHVLETTITTLKNQIENAQDEEELKVYRSELENVENELTELNKVIDSKRADFEEIEKKYKEYLKY